MTRVDIYVVHKRRAYTSGNVLTIFDLIEFSKSVAERLFGSKSDALL